MTLNQKHRRIVCVYANNPDKERREMSKMWISNRIYNLYSRILV